MNALLKGLTCVPLAVLLVWCDCVVCFMHSKVGVLVWYDCVVRWCGVFVWCDCMVCFCVVYVTVVPVESCRFMVGVCSVVYGWGDCLVC